MSECVFISVADAPNGAAPDNCASIAWCSTHNCPANGDACAVALRSALKAAEAEIEFLSRGLKDAQGSILMVWDKVSAEQSAHAATKARLEGVEAILRKVHGALNDSFSAGMEEREGGSARRQEKLMQPVDKLREEVRALLSAPADGIDAALNHGEAK